MAWVPNDIKPFLKIRVLSFYAWTSHKSSSWSVRTNIREMHYKYTSTVVYRPKKFTWNKLCTKNRTTYVETKTYVTSHDGYSCCTDCSVLIRIQMRMCYAFRTSEKTSQNNNYSLKYNCSVKGRTPVQTTRIKTFYHTRYCYCRANVRLKCNVFILFDVSYAWWNFLTTQQ